MVIKMSELFKLSFKNLYRKKRNIISTFMIGILLGLTVLIGTYYKTMNNFINKDIKNDFFYNTLLVGKKYSSEETKPTLEEIRKELENIDGIIGVFSATSRYNGLISKQFAVNGLSGRSDLYAANNETLPEIVNGTNFPDNNDNYIICPENFYPNDMDYRDLTRNDFLDIKSFIGEKIIFEYENFETKEKNYIEYKLVGTYKNNLTTMDEGVCFVNEKSLLEVYIKQRENLENFNIEDQRNFFIQVGSADSIEKITKILEHKEYTVRPTTYIDYSIFESSFQNANKYSFSLYLIIFVLLIIILFKNFKANKENNNILYYLGYKRKSIEKINLTMSLIFIFFSYIIAIFCSIIINFGLKILIYYRPLIFEKRMLLIDFNSLPPLIISTFLITIIVSLINNYRITEPK